MLIEQKIVLVFPVKTFFMMMVVSIFFTTQITDCQLFYGDYFDNLFGEEEGVHQVGEYDFVK